jgi:hypothetical protein
VPAGIMCKFSSESSSGRDSSIGDVLKHVLCWIGLNLECKQPMLEHGENRRSSTRCKPLPNSRANYTQTHILPFRTEEEFKSDGPDGPDDLTCRKGPRFASINKKEGKMASMRKDA